MCSGILRVKLNMSKRYYVKMESQVVVVYIKEGSQECERLESLLKHIGWEYMKYVQGVDYTEREFRLEFGEGAEYPQVSVGVKHIGGLKDFISNFNCI